MAEPATPKKRGRPRKGTNATQPTTTKEQINFLQKEEQRRLAYASLKDVLQLINLEKNTTKTFSTYTRDNLRTYLTNPYNTNNQQSLRRLSNYLYIVSHVYRRLVNFKANQVTCKAWNAYPNIDMTKNPNPTKVLKNYQKVCKTVKVMDMKSQIQKLMLTAWREDIVYGYTYFDNNLESEFFIHVLDGNYCKISSLNYASGVINFAFDFSYFDGSNSDLLEYYDKEFTTLYNKYKSDSKLRWQELDPTRTFCLKINSDNLDAPIPPLSGLFQSLISLVDLQDLQDLATELENTKIVTAKIPMLDGDDPDNFAIDLELANSFFKKIQSALPDQVGAALTPMDLDVMNFPSNTTTDTDMISTATSNLLDSNGGVVLNNSRISGATAYKMALMVDSADAMAPVQTINAWVNWFLFNQLGDNEITVEFDATSPFFVDDKIDQFMKAAQYGVPCKTQLGSLLGLDPVKSYSMDFLENQVLKLGTERWNVPMVNSNIQTPDEAGSNAKGTTELSPEGEETRDQGKNDEQNA